MAIQFPDNIFSNSPKPVEGKYTTLTGTPYLSTDEATGSIDINYRYKGLTVLVSSSIETAEYWWKNGTSNSDLIKKTTGTEGTFLTTASNVNNGNTLTISKSDGSGYQITIDTGSSLQSFNFTASFINKTTVNVNHNLGYKYVLVQVFDNSSNQVIPSEINLVDDTQATITFPEPTSGTAVVSVGGATFNNPTLPAGNVNSVQYNNGGVFGGSDLFTFDGTTVDILDAASQPFINSNDRTLYTPGGNTALGFSDDLYMVSNVNTYKLFGDNYPEDFSGNVLATGDLFDVDAWGAGSYNDYDLIYLESNNAWYTIDQSDVTTARQMLGINLSGRILTEGYITVSDRGSDDVPWVDGTLVTGAPVYIKEYDASAPWMSTTIPTTGIVRILGHLMYNNVNSNDHLWMMKFRPDHTWVEIV
jgi:hypothetical protein